MLACHFRGAFFVEYGLLPSNQQNPLMFAFFALTRLGHEAVLVFFVLSGFLVGGKALERFHNSSFKPRDYAIDRTVRIMLPLVSSLILALIVNWIIGKELNISILIGNLFSLQGITCPVYFDTLWSLSYEVWFYIIMCCIGYCLVYSNRPKAFFGLTVLSICFLVFTKLSACYLFVWLIGAMGFFLIGGKSRLVLYGTLIATLFLIVILQLISGSHAGLTTGTQDSSLRVYVEIVFGIVFVIYLVQAIQFPPKHKASVAINTMGTKLAAFSYTLYLTHIPIRDLLRHFGAPKCTEVNLMSIGLYLCYLTFALAVAYGMYLLFERNTKRIKQWIKAKA